jgi:acetyl-CoA acetyltransferase
MEASGEMRREAVVLAGLPVSVAGTTINRFSSGLQAIPVCQ